MSNRHEKLARVCSQSSLEGTSVQKSPSFPKQGHSDAELSVSPKRNNLSRTHKEKSTSHLLSTTNLTNKAAEEQPQMPTRLFSLSKPKEKKEKKKKGRGHRSQESGECQEVADVFLGSISWNSLSASEPVEAIWPWTEMVTEGQRSGLTSEIFQLQVTSSTAAGVVRGTCCLSSPSLPCPVLSSFHKLASLCVFQLALPQEGWFHAFRACVESSGLPRDPPAALLTFIVLF